MKTAEERISFANLWSKLFSDSEGTKEQFRVVSGATEVGCF